MHVCSDILSHNGHPSYCQREIKRKRDIECCKRDRETTVGWKEVYTQQEKNAAVVDSVPTTQEGSADRKEEIS